MFPLERVLAIYHTITRLSDSNNVHSQIATLVKLRLLSRKSQAGALDNARFMCNASLELVTEISKSLEFDISGYLYDFVHA
jgi:origin recognition complex subunit 5